MDKIIFDVINYIKDNHFNSELINWNKILKSSEKIKTYKELTILLDKYIYPKLKDPNFNYVIELNNKSLSRNNKIEYRKSKFKPYYTKPETKFGILPVVQILENNILYINAPKTQDISLLQEYFNIINNGLKNWRKYSGIIFDLSECIGGYYAPIIAPFHQIFGKTIVAHGFNNNNNKNCFTHILKKGIKKNISSWIKQIDFNPKKIYDNIDSPIKIAVIISSYTSGAGELATLFFKGRPNIKIIGEKTCGLNTWNHLASVNSNVNINISSAFIIDREGNTYSNNYEIKPDVITNNPIKKSIEYISQNNK